MSSLEDYNLRPLTEDDLATVLTWRNSERIRSNMYADHVIKSDEHRAWFTRTVKDASCRYLVLEHLGQPIGLSYVTDIDCTNGTCMWGFYVGAADAPRGSGTVMGCLSMNYIFEQEELRKVCGEVLDFNKPSQKLFGRLGFAKEGCRRQHVIKNGSYIDVVLFSLLADEWRESEKLRVLNLIENRSMQKSAT